MCRRPGSGWWSDRLCGARDRSAPAASTNANSPHYNHKLQAQLCALPRRTLILCVAGTSAPERRWAVRRFARFWALDSGGRRDLRGPLRSELCTVQRRPNAVMGEFIPHTVAGYGNARGLPVWAALGDSSAGCRCRCSPVPVPVPVPVLPAAAQKRVTHGGCDLDGDACD